MKKWIIKKLPIFIPLVILSIFLFISNWIHLNIDITTPALVSNIDNNIVISDAYPSLGTISTTSVYSIERVSLLEYLLAKTCRGTDYSASSEIVNSDNIRNSRSGAIQKQMSITNSLILAYEKAEKTIDYQYLGVIVHTLANYAPLDFQAGDIISKINGESFNNLEEFYELYNRARLDLNNYNEESKCWTIVFTINNIDKAISTNYYLETNDYLKYPVYGFYLYDHYQIDYDTLDPKVTILSTNAGGPSGGLMQTIANYNNLVEFDYTYGLKIAGTGTIDIDGTVGEIGGMYSKVFAAKLAKVDIFFVPYVNTNGSYQNYDEAMKAYDDLGRPKDLLIVPAATFDEAIDFLLNYKG